MFSWYDKTTAFWQIFSLSSSPVNDFTISNWSGLVDTIMYLLNNPRFLCFIGVILLMSILPTVDDE